MKGPLILLLLVALVADPAAGQQKTVDRLVKKLNEAATVDNKAVALDSLTMFYMWFMNKPDSTFEYAKRFINFSLTQQDKKYLILAYARMGFYYINVSEYKAALDISLRALKLSQEYNIPDFLSALYYNVSWVYFNLDDHVRAFTNARMGKFHLTEDKDRFMDQQLHLDGLIGNIHLSEDKMDSARYYFKQVNLRANVSEELAAKDIAAWYWGMFFLRTAEYPKADSVLSIGIASCKQNGDFLLDFFLVFSARSKIRQHKIAEAIVELKNAHALSIQNNDLGGAMQSAYLLTDCFDRIGNRDDAYRYLTLADSLNEVIQSHGSAQEIQQIRLDQQLKQQEEDANQLLQDQKNKTTLTVYVAVTTLIFLSAIVGILWRNNRQRKTANELLQAQKDRVEGALSELKATQAQLVQSEKMASLGELTAGIAHEIQNPLNFVNNFSEVNSELIGELKSAVEKGNLDEAKAIAATLEENENKIISHGKRADGIVKGMLQHSRTSSGKKEPTDINALCDEYLRLAYHGLRAKDKSFNAKFETNLDPTLGSINVMPQEIGRVILNLINNAFYAVMEKKKQNPNGYEPTVTVGTAKRNGSIEIRVNDNGGGIPGKIKDKIFQPFFTTKPTGQGTGLGLSLSYDIVTKGHGGTLTFETTEGEGTTFIIQLPQ